jgi:hypothetical protein
MRTSGRFDQTPVLNGNKKTQNPLKLRALGGSSPTKPHNSPLFDAMAIPPTTRSEAATGHSPSNWSYDRILKMIGVGTLAAGPYRINWSLALSPQYRHASLVLKTCIALPMTARPNAGQGTEGSEESGTSG